MSIKEGKSDGRKEMKEGRGKGKETKEGTEGRKEKREGNERGKPLLVVTKLS